jgi:uncharacterized SAM-binding protein YcdF (DUF218 family)
MHELASTLAAFLLSPFNWMLALMVAPFIVKSARSKKICLLSALSIFILFSNQWILNAYAKIWNPKPTDITKDLTIDKPYSCGIVLGGFGSPDENGDGYFNVGSDRFIQAVELYRLGKVQHILISGGNGKDMDKDFKEGKWAKEQMEIMGVPGSAIFYEDVSDNTADNAANSKRILDSAALPPPYLLITSAFHVPRAAQIFRNAGIPIIEYPSNYMEGRDGFKFWGFIPKPKNMFAWNDYLKETVGYVFYYLKGKL